MKVVAAVSDVWLNFISVIITLDYNTCKHQEVNFLCGHVLFHKTYIKVYSLTYIIFLCALN